MITINANTLKLLNVFVQVINAGSFAGAARKMTTSRSRVSEQVSTLELQLNVRLLHRNTRSLQLTMEGEKLYEKAKQLELILQEIEQDLVAEEPSGVVRLTMNQDVAEQFIIPFLPKFVEQFPKVTLDFVLDDKPLNLVEQQIDLAIRVGIPKDSSLIARPLHQDSFGLFASPAFIAKHGLPNTIDHISALPWICLTQLASNNGLEFYEDETLHIVKPTHFHQCDSPRHVQIMAAMGLGIAVLLPSMIKDELQTGQLIPLFPSFRGKPLVFSLVYPSRKQLPQRTQAVIDFILQECKF